MAVCFTANLSETVCEFHSRLLDENTLVADFGELQFITLDDWYEGLYTVTPSQSQQVLETEGKLMSDNVVVNSIPFYKTGNNYGYTIYIGSEV